MNTITDDDDAVRYDELTDTFYCADLSGDAWDRRWDQDLREFAEIRESSDAWPDISDEDLVTTYRAELAAECEKHLPYDDEMGVYITTDVDFAWNYEYQVFWKVVREADGIYDDE